MVYQNVKVSVITTEAFYYKSILIDSKVCLCCSNYILLNINLSWNI